MFLTPVISLRPQTEINSLFASPPDVVLFFYIFVKTVFELIDVGRILYVTWDAIPQMNDTR